MTRTSRLAGATALAVVLVLSVLGSSAVAVWTLTANGDGATRSGALVAPTVSVEQSTSNPETSLVVKWTAADQLPGATYVVKRGATTLTCTTSPCTDTGLTTGQTYDYSVTAHLHSWTSPAGSGSGTTAAASATSFVVAAPSSAAGSSSTITITAKRADGTTDTNYTGNRQVTWSGTAGATSPNGTAATLPASVVFANGVASVNVTLTYAGTGRSLTLSDGSINGSATLNVTPGVRSSFTVTPSTSSVAANAQFNVTLTAYDAYGNQATNFTRANNPLTWTDEGGTAGSLNSPNGAPPNVTNGNFAGGTVTLTGIRFVKAGANQTFRVSDGTAAGNGTISVTAGPASRLAYTSVVFAGANASSTNAATITSCYTTASCSVSGLGNDGSVTARVSLTDVYGNLSSAGGSTTISFATSPANKISNVVSGGTTIAGGSSTSTWTVKLQEGTPSYSTTMTASASGLTSIGATISKN